jgi:hypothetical protein
VGHRSPLPFPCCRWLLGVVSILTIPNGGSAPRRSLSCHSPQIWGSLDGVGGVVHPGNDDFSFEGCGPSLARWCRQPQWWGRLRGLHYGNGVHLFMVKCNGLAAALASTTEGETAWCLLSWEGPLSAVWLRPSAGCGRGALVEFLLCWRVMLLPWLDCPGGCRCDRCVVVDLLDACSLMLGYVLSVSSMLGVVLSQLQVYLILCVMIIVHHLYFLLNTIHGRHTS